MPRYIDADALRERIEYYHSHTGDQRTNAEHYAYGVVLEEIDKAPSVNVDKVTHCKDCGYYHQKKDFGYCDRPFEAPVQRFPNDFCSKAVKREKNNA